MRALRATVALLSVLALTTAVPAPALAERHGVTAPLGPRPIEDAPAASAADGAIATLTTAAPRADALPVSEVTSPVAPGLDLTEFDRLDARGWIRGDVLTADLGRGTLRPAYLSPGVVAARSPLSEQAAARGVVAGSTATSSTSTPPAPRSASAWTRARCGTPPPPATTSPRPSVPLIWDVWPRCSSMPPSPCPAASA